MTICQSRISPFGKVRRGRCLSIYSSPPPENHGLKIKNRPTKQAFISIPLKAGEKDRSNAKKKKKKKKATAYKSVAQSGTIKPSCEWRRRWRGGGHIHFFTTEGNNAGEEKKNTHAHTPLSYLTVWVFCFTKCLRNVYESGAV